MKFNESWLNELIDPGLKSDALGDCLTMAGLELESLETAAPLFNAVVVGVIDNIEAHPDADKLRVCQVSIGENSSVQVVCGAANARQGLRVALAQVGTELPQGMKIRKAKLRGVESSGMLCSAAELGLSESSDGILELADNAPIGADLRQYLDLDDLIYEVDLTPNRADCLSVTGIARELAVLTGRPLKKAQLEPVNATINDQFPVRIEGYESCPKYAGRVVRGVSATALTPPWMQERLRRCGIRSLGSLVDITNYVMLELGQPMHAFDLHKLKGGIVVRKALSDESLILLDGVEVALDDQTLVIADQDNVLALAGVMGGSYSAVSDETVDIFLESAFFRPEVIAGKARSYGLHTESSHRFERGVDFRLQATAIERATRLILDICGGQPGPVSELSSEESLPQLSPVALRRTQIERILGVSLRDTKIVNILSGLGCELSSSESGWSVVPPSYRFDLQIEVDLIEELARVYGYDNIPAHSRSWAPVIEAEPEATVSLQKIKSEFVDLGYQEVITYSFVDAKTEGLLNPGYQAMILENPISSELSTMRTTLWGGMLQAVSHNLRRQQSRVRIFETGLVFIPGESGLEQRQRIAGAVMGSVLPEQWASPSRDVDFFDIKGDLQSLLDMRGLDYQWASGRHAALHPGQTAEIFCNGQSVGWVGSLHPELQQKLDVSKRVFLFEFDIATMMQAELPAFRALSRFPAVRRDLALLVDESVSYGQISSSIEVLELEILSEYQIFDVYQGEGLVSGRKSLALGLILQELSRTLEEDEVERTVSLILKKLKADVGASLRT
ncbi:MAG: phenylalanine--tRNA ligase subunit beta [Thiothrix sp.]|nr:MAG: phenylalanine--tRNA ligase subunit beta [Thiothrix sp.]